MRQLNIYRFDKSPSPASTISPLLLAKLKEAGIIFSLTVTKMMSSTLMILVSVMTMAALSGEAFAALPAQCNPGYLDELPPRLRKICIAIARIWDVRDMNDFVDDRGNQSPSTESLPLPPPCAARFFDLFNESRKAKYRAHALDPPSPARAPTLSLPRNCSPLY